MTDEDELRSEERRNFLKLTGTGAFTAAAVAAGAGVLGSSEAVAQTAREEQERQDEAEMTMNIATAYKIGATRSYPLMQLDIKENIQNTSNGRIYVKLAPGGQLGAGGALVQKVQGATVHAAQHSVSNFAPFAPAADLINLPYFCGANQDFVNLVTSEAWKKEINPRVNEKGFRPLLYLVIDPRTTALRKGVKGPAKVPSDLSGIKFRVPGSQMLQQYYRTIGTNPTPVAWGETPSALKQGVADALDPAVGALHVFGFKEILGYISFTKAVPDSQVYSCNLEWFNSLDSKLQEAVDWASEMTFHQNLSKVPSARAYAMAEMRKAGVEFYSPTEDELAQWKEAGGYQREEWDNYKTDLAGSMETFKKLEEAVATKGRYYVNDA